MTDVEVPDYKLGDTFYPEPIWALWLTAAQVDLGAWVNIDPAEIVDYRINPFEDGWRARYKQSAIDKLVAVGWE